MTEEREVLTPSGDEPPRWMGLAVAVLAVVALIALGVGWSASMHAKNVEQSLNNQTQSLKQSLDTLSQRLSQAEDAGAQSQAELNIVTDKLKLTQGQLQNARRQAKQAREDSEKKLADMQTSVDQQLSTKANSTDVQALGTDVSGVKTDLESTKQNLQMAKGEFGTLIARNHDDIEQLRRLGERDYYEFTIDKRNLRQNVGSITVELRGTNVKHNLFTVTIFADDTRYEKKNRSTNEPIYFYTRGTRAPLEFVVNQVGKDKIVGYLSVPKSNAAPQTSGTGN